MEKQISKITTETNGQFSFINIVGDSETIAKILQFATSLNLEIQSVTAKKNKPPF